MATSTGETIFQAIKRCWIGSKLALNSQIIFHLPSSIFHALSPPTGFQDLIDIVSTVLVRCLQIVQPLLQLVDIRLQLSRFRGQASLDIHRRAEDEPMNRDVRKLENAPLHGAHKGK